MGRITHDSSAGRSPRSVKGATGVVEVVGGRITWHSSGQFECAEGRRMIFVGMIPNGDRKWALARSEIELDREFIRRLGKYDRDEHRQLVSVLDWAETRGLDVQAADSRCSCDLRILLLRGRTARHGNRRKCARKHFVNGAV